eukprot:489464-Amphidinium_carterae.1
MAEGQALERVSFSRSYAIKALHDDIFNIKAARPKTCQDRSYWLAGPGSSLAMPHSDPEVPKVTKVSFACAKTASSKPTKATTADKFANLAQGQLKEPEPPTDPPTPEGAGQGEICNPFKLK